VCNVADEISLITSLIIVTFENSSNQDVSCCMYFLCPKDVTQLGIFQHGFGHFLYYFFLPFDNSILLRCPSCWEVYFIPWLWQKSMNYFDVNSPPLSNLKHLIFNSVSISTNFFYILKCLNASNFFLRKKIVVIFV
jgi:hypothetical protein